MLERTTRIIAGFLITAACYTAYAVAVVPLIEPPLPDFVDEPLTDEDLRHLEANAEKQRAELRYWFAEHDWELDSPKIIETPQCKLLFDDYRPMENGLVELKPCSMVFLSTDTSGSEEDRKRRALVLRAPDGALLRFESAIDLRQAKLSKLIGGELLGEVQIVGGQRLPGPEDDLMITTRDVMLSETDISTPHLLEYRLGSHRGRGRGVAIELDNVEVAGKKEMRGIKMLTLHEQVFVHLEADNDDDLFPGNKPAAAKPAAAQFVAAPAGVKGDGKPKQSSAPIEIRCSGPFTFDMIQNVAVFRRSVDVTRRNPSGENDQINGEMLKVFFTAKETAPAAAPAAQGPFKNANLSAKNLQPSRIEIVGEPAVVRAPTNKLQARAQVIEHDLASRAVKLRDADEAIVRQENNEIRTPELQFTPDAEGRYGTFIADGRGRIVGASPDDPTQTFHAEWQRRLHFRNHEGQNVLSAIGGARVEAVGKGALAADEIHLWLKEVTKPLAAQDPAAPLAAADAGKSQTELVADRVLALGKVKITSTEFNSDVERLEGWFEYADAGPGMRQAGFRGVELAQLVALPAAEPLAFPPSSENTPATAPPPQVSDPLRTAVPLQLAERNQPAAQFAAPPQVAPAPPAFNQVPPVAGVAPQPGPSRERQYHIAGELMRLLVHVVDKKMHVREATVERQVRLTEISAPAAIGANAAAPAVADAQPLLIQGDMLQLSQPTAQSSFVTVTGNPAYVEARGMTMSGGKLTLDRPDEQTNHVAVPGQGLMTLPIDRDLQGRPTGSREVLNLTWQGSLQFDGLTARFERGIEARTSSQLLRTDRLDVTFTEQVGFGKSNQSSKAQPDIRRVDCFDGVFLESRTIELGALKSVDRLNSRTLSLDRPTGDVTADGPGELVSVRLGTRGAPQLPGGTAPPGAGVPAIPLNGEGNVKPGAPSINYLQTTFQRGMAGNEARREMNFYNQVRVVYGPVADWNTAIDPDRPEQWTQDTVLIKCDQLQVTSIKELAAPPFGGGPAKVTESYNLVAAGNTLVEGTAYTARAPRVTYAQGKDLLVIEGDQRTPAELYHQKQVGGQNSGTTAQRFMVWPSTNRVQVDGATFLELTP